MWRMIEHAVSENKPELKLVFILPLEKGERREAPGGQEAEMLLVLDPLRPPCAGAVPLCKGDNSNQLHTTIRVPAGFIAVFIVTSRTGVGHGVGGIQNHILILRLSRFIGLHAGISQTLYGHFPIRVVDRCRTAICAFAAGNNE